MYTSTSSRRVVPTHSTKVSGAIGVDRPFLGQSFGEKGTGQRSGVLEFVEVSSRMNKGPSPVSEALGLSYTLYIVTGAIPDSFPFSSLFQLPTEVGIVRKYLWVGRKRVGGAERCVSVFVSGNWNSSFHVTELYENISWTIRTPVDPL